MNILHISHFGRRINGIREVVVSTANIQISLGHKVKVGFIDEFEGYNSKQYCYLKDSRQFKKLVKDFKPDIVIFHALFYLKYIKLYKILLSQNIPYIIKQHGAASFENYAKNHLKKVIAVKLKFGKFIKKANALSFLNVEEKNNFSLIKYNSNYIIEPNGISSIIPKENYVIGEKINFSFIGRIAYHHKGIDILLKAFKLLHDNPIKQEVEFNFYGPLYDEIFKKDIAPYSDFVKWHPPVTGTEKKEVYKRTDVFVLTSRFEGMPMGILEALSNGVPCLVTPQTNMSNLILSFNSGWVTELNEYKIVECIDKIVKEIRPNYADLSKNANNSVHDYQWNEIVKNSIVQYETLI